MKSATFSIIALVVVTVVHFLYVLEASKSRQRLVAIAERWQSTATGAVAAASNSVAVAENAIRVARFWESNANEWQVIATNCMRLKQP